MSWLAGARILAEALRRSRQPEVRAEAEQLASALLSGGGMLVDATGGLIRVSADELAAIRALLDEMRERKENPE